MLTFTPPTLLIGIYFRAESFNILWNDDEILYNTSTRDLWKLKFSIKKHILLPAIESGSIAWKATMLTITPPTLLTRVYCAAESFNILWNDDEILYNTSTRYLWKLKFSIKKYMFPPWIETGPFASKATILTFLPPTLLITICFADDSFIFSGPKMKLYIIPPLDSFENANVLF